MTLQSSIQKYIAHQISSMLWKPGEKIMSENQIALRFHCSRLTARQALLPLVYSGQLLPMKGKGYIVSKHSKSIYFLPFAKHIGSNNSKTHEIKGKMLEHAKKLLNININDNVFIFEKTYLKDEQVLSKQLTAINKEIILINDYKIFNSSITTALAQNGAAIQKTDFEIKFQQNNYFDVFKTELDWKYEYPLEIITSYSEIDWIEKSIRITRKKYFKIIFTKFKY